MASLDSSSAAKIARSGKRAGWQSAVILETRPQTPRINSVFLAPERPFAFRPGQYVSVRVAANGSLAERKYSIASAPEAGAIIELAIEALPGGEVSGYFHSQKAVGDTIDIRGPRGGFTWSVADGGPTLLIAGGSGLVPLMSMIRHRTLRHSSVPIGLIYSAITWDDILFRDELLELSSAADGIELLLTLTREAPRDSGVHAGRVDTAMIQQMQRRLSTGVSGVFTSGSEPFVEHVRALLGQVGVSPELVHVESYGI
jgi:ferredoxin-NADP reductase